jgi:hypothetical protein
MDAFTAFVRDILTTLNPQGVAELRVLQLTPTGYYADDGWLYTYSGIRLFVVTTCKLYKRDHGRYSGGDQQHHALKVSRSRRKSVELFLSRFSFGETIIRLQPSLYAVRSTGNQHRQDSLLYGGLL